MFVAPADRFVVGRTAQDVFTRFYSGRAGLRRDPDVALLGRLAQCGRSVVHGELFSYLFAAEEFVSELISLGQADATAWLSADHADGPWHRGHPSHEAGTTCSH